MLIEGEKYACESCVKGHRVSNCNHRDRPLKHIAPKGRPVKQCEHCRDARKSKSHHAKCDCGSKRPKDKKSEPKSEDHGCCCHIGTECLCSNKADSSDLRLETSLSRQVNNAKAKPKLTTSSSDSTLPTFAGGHHKPLHRHNNLAHTSGAPYKIPRPHTLHGASAFAEATRRNTDDVPQRAVDDLLLYSNSSSSKLYNTGGAQLSAEDLRLSSQAASLTNFESKDMWGIPSGSSGSPFEEDLVPTTSADMITTSMTWFESSLPAVAEGNEDLALMPSTSITGMSDWEWSNIPSATTEYFSPSDLPLVPDPGQLADYAQPISHSGESSYQSAPGLTASSSGAQSEAAFPVDNSQQTDILGGYWNDTIVFRPQSYDSQADIGNGFSFPIANMETTNMSSQRKSQSPINDFAFTPPTNHTHNLSDSTAVPDTNTSDSGVNAGHLANLASLSSSQTLTESYDNIDSSEPGIMIPVGSDEAELPDGYWNFPTTTPTTAADQAANYAWLQ